MFARAIVIDPDYARAFAGVADCCSFLYMWFEANEDNLREASAASRRAVELDPESAEGHASRGLALSLNRDYVEAEQEFETAIRLNPRLFEAYYFYGRARFTQGRNEQAAELFKSASGANPDDYQSLNLLGLCYRSMGRLDDAREARANSLRVIEHHLEFHPDDVRAIYMGAHALCETGDRARSLEWAAHALALDPEEASVLYNLACTYSLLGEEDKALDCLDNAFQHGFGHRDWFEKDPDFAPIRSHPRFQMLMQRLSAK